MPFTIMHIYFTEPTFLPLNLYAEDYSYVPTMAPRKRSFEELHRFKSIPFERNVLDKHLLNVAVCSWTMTPCGYLFSKEKNQRFKRSSFVQGRLNKGIAKNPKKDENNYRSDS